MIGLLVLPLLPEYTSLWFSRFSQSSSPICLVFPRFISSSPVPNTYHHLSSDSDIMAKKFQQSEYLAWNDKPKELIQSTYLSLTDSSKPVMPAASKSIDVECGCNQGCPVHCRPQASGCQPSTATPYDEEDKPELQQKNRLPKVSTYIWEKWDPGVTQLIFSFFFIFPSLWCWCLSICLLSNVLIWNNKKPSWIISN